MSMQGEGKDAKGRNYDQVTKDGSSSAGTLGAGGTGDVDRDCAGEQAGAAPGGASRQHGRTDDLLTPDPERDRRQGFTPGPDAGKPRTGLGGTGGLPRQGVMPGEEMGHLHRPQGRKDGGEA